MAKWVKSVASNILVLIGMTSVDSVIMIMYCELFSSRENIDLLNAMVFSMSSIQTKKQTRNCVFIYLYS